MMSQSGASGGCQCGAVRFSVDGALGRPTICHCRMCQKAFGSFFGPFVTAPALRWTRGAPKYFQSSNRVRRGFCADCGTPLTYEADKGPPEVAIGAFDDPAALRPVLQLAVEARLPWLGEMADLPVLELGAEDKMTAFYASISTFQHPDRDTETWPAKP
jgi:hypothetical protein